MDKSIRIRNYNGLKDIKKELGRILLNNRNDVHLSLSEVRQRTGLDERLLSAWESGKGLILVSDLVRLFNLYKCDKANAYLSYIGVRLQFLKYCLEIVKDLPVRKMRSEKELGVLIKYDKLEDRFFANGINLKYNTYRQLGMVKPRKNSVGNNVIYGYLVLDYFIYKTIYEGRFMGFNYGSIKKLYDACLKKNGNIVDKMFYVKFRYALYCLIIDNFSV